MRLIVPSVVVIDRGPFVSCWVKNGLREAAVRRVPSVVQSARVPDLAARRAAPVRREVTALLVVVTFSDVQKGQALGATVGSAGLEGWVNMPLVS